MKSSRNKAVSIVVVIAITRCLAQWAGEDFTAYR
jgi:hypothetical protein